MQYYFQGCSSWNWYYPYHYAPFASDFGEVDGKVDNEFETGTAPVRPLEQLMSVFPPGSSHYLPGSWAKLMTDPASPMLSAYPTEFVTDLNGKKLAWQGVIFKMSPAERFVVVMALSFLQPRERPSRTRHTPYFLLGVTLLPFLDQEKLLGELKTRYADLTEDEMYRNRRSCDLLVVHASHPLQQWRDEKTAAGTWLCRRWCWCPFHLLFSSFAPSVLIFSARYLCQSPKSQRGTAPRKRRGIIITLTFLCGRLSGQSSHRRQKLSRKRKSIALKAQRKSHRSPAASSPRPCL
jgi:hypothetical protein